MLIKLSFNFLLIFISALHTSYATTDDSQNILNCDLRLSSLASDTPSKSINFDREFKMVSQTGQPNKKGPEGNFSIKQTYVKMIDAKGNFYAGVIQGVRPQDIKPGQPYDVQYYNDKIGQAVASLDSSQFAVAAYDSLMQSMSHGEKKFSVSNLEFIPSNEFKDANQALLHVADLYMAAFKHAKKHLGTISHDNDASVLEYLSEQYYKIEEHYYKHFPELRSLGSLKVPINENMTTSDHARNVFSNLMVMLVALGPILSQLGSFEYDKTLVSLLSFGFNHDFLKASVAAVAGRAHQDRANLPFRRFIEPTLGLSNEIVEFAIGAKWDLMDGYFTNWRTTNEHFVRDESKTSDELLNAIKTQLESSGFEPNSDNVRSYFWFSIIAEMADGTGYGLQNTYTMFVLPNGGRALIPAADRLEDRASGRVNSFFLEVLQKVDPIGYDAFINLLGVNNESNFARKAVLRVSDEGRFVFNP